MRSSLLFSPTVSHLLWRLTATEIVSILIKTVLYINKEHGCYKEKWEISYNDRCRKVILISRRIFLPDAILFLA